jgi:hypothetical protein
VKHQRAIFSLSGIAVSPNPKGWKCKNEICVIVLSEEEKGNIYTLLQMTFKVKVRPFFLHFLKLTWEKGYLCITVKVD